MRHGKYRRLLRLINRILGKIYTIISFSEKLFFIKSGFIVWTGEDFQRRERNSIQLGLLRFRVGFVFWYVSFSGTFRFRIRFVFLVCFVFGYVSFSGTLRFWVRFVFGYFSFLGTFRSRLRSVFGYVLFYFWLRFSYVSFTGTFRYVSFAVTFRFRLRFIFGYVSFSVTFRFPLRFVFGYVSIVCFLLLRFVFGYKDAIVDIKRLIFFLGIYI